MLASGVYAGSDVGAEGPIVGNGAKLMLPEGAAVAPIVAGIDV